MSDEDYKTVKILLVEDDDIDAMSVERSLKKMRLLNPLIRATDGAEALELLQSGKVSKPYIILLDINLPKMNGLEFLKKLREDKTLKDSIVFVLTTSSTEEEITAAYRNHVAGYIVKTKLNQDFTQLIGFLDHYWRLVEMPS